MLSYCNITGIALTCLLFVFVWLHDLIAQGRVNIPTDTKPGEKLWEFETDGKIRSSPVVSDGHVYFGSSDHRIYALNRKNGEKVWDFETGNRVSSSPAVSNDRLFVGGVDGNVYGIDKETGKKIWVFKTKRMVTATPVVDNGHVFVGSHDDHVYALRASDGEMSWRFKTGGDISFSAAVAGGRIFVGSDDHQIYALNAATGKLIWKFNTSGNVYSPAVAKGKVFITTNEREIFALHPIYGDVIWRSSEVFPFSSPSISGQSLYVGGVSLAVLALDTGKMIWSKKVNQTVSQTSPVIGKTRVFFGGARKIYSFQKDTGKKVWSSDVSSQVFASPAIDNGRLYVGSVSGSMYAYKIKKEESCWPMLGQNPQRTGVSPTPSLSKDMKKDFKRLFACAKRLERKKVSKIISSWNNGTHPVTHFLPVLVDILKNIHDKDPQAFKDWHQEGTEIALHYPDLFKRVVKIIQQHDRTEKYFEILVERLGSNSYKRRKETMRQLEKAGVLAFPILRRHQKVPNPEIRWRVNHLLKKLKNHWAEFVGK